jgi:hypothetical protein
MAKNMIPSGPSRLASENAGTRRNGRDQNVRKLSEGIRRRPLEQLCASAHRNRNERVQVCRGPQRARHYDQPEERDRQQNDGRKHGPMRGDGMQQRQREQAERKAQGCELLPRPHWSAALHAAVKASPESV